MRILVIGGTGFIGRHLIARLSGGQHQILVPTRRYGQGRELQILPTVTLVDSDVHDDDALDRLVRGCDAVVNLVGILHGNAGRPYGSDFAKAHVHLPQRIARACRRQGVRRLLHVSALGADSSGASMYQRSKGDGEAAIKQELAGWREGGWTLFRPSVVFGPDDNFTNLFARLARWLPVLPLAVASTFLVGTLGALGPALQVRLMDVAGEAQTLAAALNHSAFNAANALGAWLGGMAVLWGWGWASTGWVGVALALGGLAVFAASAALQRRALVRG